MFLQKKNFLFSLLSLCALAAGAVVGPTPQTQFSAEYVTGESSSDLVYRDGDVIYVDIGENGCYSLETVNAIGVPLETLYKGTWDVGEHSLAIDMKTIQPSSYIVLRKGAEILSWRLLN